MNSLFSKHGNDNAHQIKIKGDNTCKVFGKRLRVWKELIKEDEGGVHVALLELLRDAEFKE